MKYVSVCWRSAGGDACITPEMPPMVKRPTSPIANFMAVENWMEPPHMVKIQLKIFTPVGMAMSSVVTPNTLSPMAPMPTANMWCAQTPKTRNAMSMVAYTMTRYPQIGLREKAGMISDVSPNAGRMRM